MRVRYVLVAVHLLFLSGNVAAGELAYTCEVNKVYKLTENSTLETSAFEKQMKGSSFSVLLPLEGPEEGKHPITTILE